MHPAYLKTGDTIAILSTARSITEAELQVAVNELSSWSLKVVFGKTIGQFDRQFAGTDAERLADLQAHINNPSIKAILCARGGYGTMRLLDGLDLSSLKQYPKWICGFSDITVLLSQLQGAGEQCIHSLMPSVWPSLGCDASTETLRKALFGELLNYSFAQSEYNRDGEASGILVGGNLSLLYAMKGTSYEPDYDGKVLFIEDLDEYLYHWDRMMLAMKQAGRLKNLAALVVGSFTDIRDNDIPFGRSIQEIILEAVAEYDYPVYFNFPAGHQKTNYSLKIGAMCSLTKQNNSIIFTQ